MSDADERALERVRFVERMVHLFPEFAPAYDDWAGYPPYRLMSQFAFELLEWEEGSILELADRVFGFLEAEYTKAEEVADESLMDLIAIGFLESLWGDQPRNRSLAARLPPKLAERYNLLWKPE